MAKVDLHIHSDYSDGSNTVEELLSVIQKNNIKIFALTDHDTIEGCKKLSTIIPSNIKFIPGIELTCIDGNLKSHILGYNCDFNNEELNNLIKKGKIMRKRKLDTRIEFLKNVWNIILTDKEKEWLYSRNSVVKLHIANILVNRGLEKDNLSAMDKYLKGCKTKNSRFEAKEAINAITSSGGIPVWAHPLGGEGEKHDSKEEFLTKIEKMISLGIKGLECYYSRYNNSEIEFLVNCAKANDLYISGGSDYHGVNKTNIMPAQLNAENSYIDSTLLNMKF